MGFLDDAKGFLDKITGTGEKDKVSDSRGAEDFLEDLDTVFYQPKSQNWYSAQPYGFKLTQRDNSIFTMFLPINPSNLTITTNFATNVIPTLYGTVEEHSEVRYYDISIEGTTGIAPRYVVPSKSSPSDAYTASSPGRLSFPISEGISSALGGFFAQTLGTIQKIAQTASDLINGAPKPKRGFDDAVSGYMAFHNLYRFLLQYKKDAAGEAGLKGVRKDHPLVFFNYKDNNQYNVAVEKFVLRRTAADPMLYFYSIQLRGYALDDTVGDIIDNIGERYGVLGVDGVKDSSLFSKMKNLSSGVKSIVGSAVGGMNILGR